jgi:hypothetical protein
MSGDLNRWFNRELKKIANEAIDLQKEFDSYEVVDIEEFGFKESFLYSIKGILNNLSELEEIYQDLYSSTLPKKMPKETKTWDSFSVYGENATCVNSSAFWSYLEMVGFVDTFTRTDGTKVFYFS